MKRYVFPLVAIGLLQCTSVIAQKKRSDNPHAPGEDIYKHYTGTMGSKQITLDLMYGYQGASNYGGSNYYSSDDNILTSFAIQEPASFEHNVQLHAGEFPESTSLSEVSMTTSDNMPTWDFKIIGNKLNGRWKSADGKRSYNVDLKEDYGNSMPLDIVVLNDTSVARDESGKRPLRSMHYVGVKTSENSKSADAEFFTKEALSFLQDSKSSDLPAYYKNYVTKYVSGTSGSSDLLMVNFLPTYNDVDLLVMKSESVTLTSKNSIQATVSYLILDMKGHKRLAPEDMLDVSNAKLSLMLESAARKKYGFTPGEKLSKWLVKDKVTPTKNFYPGHKGFYFTYQAGELAKSKGITLFLPYDQVEEMMPKAFRKRVE